MPDLPEHSDPPPPPHSPTKWQRRIPNLLTFARLVLAAVFFALLSVFEFDSTTPVLLPVAIVVFVIAALTDALDGYLARRWHASSPLGRVMDPFADKVLILGAFVMLLAPGFQTEFGSISGFAGWMVVAILARELLVTSIRGVYESRGVDFSASFSGKAKMVLQSVAVPLVLLIVYLSERGNPEPLLTPLAASNTCRYIAWIVTFASVWSAVPYVSRAIKMRGALSG